MEDGDFYFGFDTFKHYPRFYEIENKRKVENKIEKDIILSRLEKGEIDVDKAIELLKNKYGVD